MSYSIHIEDKEYRIGDYVHGVIKSVAPNGTIFAEIGKKYETYQAIIPPNSPSLNAFDPYITIKAGTKFRAILQDININQKITLSHIEPQQKMNPLQYCKYRIRKKFTFIQKNRPPIPTHIYNRNPKIGDTIIARVEISQNNGFGLARCISYPDSIEVFYIGTDRRASMTDCYRPIVDGMYITGNIADCPQNKTTNNSYKIDNVIPIYTRLTGPRKWWYLFRRLVS